MNIGKYSERVQGFIQSAQTMALSRNNQQFTPEHILKVLIDDEEGLAASLIERAGGSAKDARLAVDAAIEAMPKVEGGNGQLYLSQPLAKVFATAEDLAKKAGDSFVTVERLLQALAMEKSAKSADILAKAGVTPTALNQAINDLRKGRTADSASAEQGYDALKKYARDLTKDAREGKLDPVIGRDDEIRRTIQVLSRRTKNNPVLIGEPGVGGQVARVFLQRVIALLGRSGIGGAALAEIVDRLVERLRRDACLGEYVGGFGRLLDGERGEQPLDRDETVAGLPGHLLGGGENLGQRLRHVELAVAAFDLGQCVERGLDAELHGLDVATGAGNKGSRQTLLVVDEDFQKMF